MEPIIYARNLNLHYGDFHALKDINIDIPEKQITALIGPSGCGKSTFLKTLNRMQDLVPGVRITGATAYFADGDGRVGSIILQKAVDVLPDDDPESLRRRVMEEAEWKLLSQAVALYCGGKLSVHGNRVVIKNNSL